MPCPRRRSAARRGRSRPSATPCAAAQAKDADAGQPVDRHFYRLALTSDPTYAAYFGTDNVLAEKVTLINRVNQIYNDDIATELRLVNGTDKLNFDTEAKATGANGPCGVAPCFAEDRATATAEDDLPVTSTSARPDPRPEPHGARPADRRLELRHRSHRPRQRRWRHRLPRRRRRRLQGRRLHRPPRAQGRLLRHRLRRPRDRATSSAATTPTTSVRRLHGNSASRPRPSSRARARR